MVAGVGDCRVLLLEGEGKVALGVRVVDSTGSSRVTGCRPKNGLGS